MAEQENESENENGEGQETPAVPFWKEHYLLIKGCGYDCCLPLFDDQETKGLCEENCDEACEKWDTEGSGYATKEECVTRCANECYNDRFLAWRAQYVDTCQRPSTRLYLDERGRIGESSCTPCRYHLLLAMDAVPCNIPNAVKPAGTETLDYEGLTYYIVPDLGFSPDGGGESLGSWLEDADDEDSSVGYYPIGTYREKSIAYGIIISYADVFSELHAALTNCNHNQTNSGGYAQADIPANYEGNVYWLGYASGQSTGFGIFPNKPGSACVVRAYYDEPCNGISARYVVRSNVTDYEDSGQIPANGYVDVDVPPCCSFGIELWGNGHNEYCDSTAVSYDIILGAGNCNQNALDTALAHFSEVPRDTCGAWEEGVALVSEMEMEEIMEEQA